MKLIMAIVHDEDAQHVTEVLLKEGYSVTKLASTGGFLRTGNTTLICGAEEARVNKMISIIERNCRSRQMITSANTAYFNTVEYYNPYPVEVMVGGATIFVLDVAEFKKV